MRDYKNLIESTRARLNPEDVSFQKSFNEELSTLSYSDALTFVRLAMKSVEPEYTEKSKEAGDKVKTHLSNGLSNVSFRYQGSVMTNTHIKGHSDIDLLAISDRFYTLDSNRISEILNDSITKSKFHSSSINKLVVENNKSDYEGNPIEELKKLRLNSETILYGVYDECDTTKPKAIKITNKNLNRDVDIVIASWYDDVRSIIYDKGDNRGIQIYNKAYHFRESPDYPFVRIHNINSRSSETKGRLKKMIRFLKTIKAESEVDIDLTSFDISAICYDIDVTKYRYLSYPELVNVLCHQLKSISTNQRHSDDVASIDDREYIFRGKPDKVENVRKILTEVEAIALDLQKVPIYG